VLGRLLEETLDGFVIGLVAAAQVSGNLAQTQRARHQPGCSDSNRVSDDSTIAKDVLHETEKRALLVHRSLLAARFSPTEFFGCKAVFNPPGPPYVRRTATTRVFISSV
jgi:hypothetical protein